MGLGDSRLDKETRQGKSSTLFVEVLIKTENGVLLLKRGQPPLKGYWNLPRGMVEFKEPPLELSLERRKKKLISS